MNTVSALNKAYAYGMNAYAKSAQDAATTALALGQGSPASGSGKRDTVQFSAQSELLTQQLLLPTANTVQELSAQLSAKLSSVFGGAGITVEPPVELKVNPGTGEVTVKGNRADAAQIEALLNGDSELQRSIQTLNAVGSHAHAIASQQQAQKSGYGAYTPSQYNPNLTIVFDGTTAELQANGRNWLADSAA